MTREELMQTKAFQKAPLELKLETLRAVDPSFASLDPKEQGSIIYSADPKAQKLSQYLTQSAPSEDKGFLTRIGEIVSSLPGQIAETSNLFADPLQPGYAKAVTSGLKEADVKRQNVVSQFQKGTQDVQQGNVLSGLARYIAASSNFVPSLGVQQIANAPSIGEKLAEDKPGEALADLTVALAPEAANIPGVRGATKGAIKGAYEASTRQVPIPYRGPRVLAKALLGKETLPAWMAGALGGEGLDWASSVAGIGKINPFLAAGAGAAIPLVTGALKGAKAGWQEAGGFGGFQMPRFGGSTGARTATAEYIPLLGEPTINWTRGNNTPSTPQATPPSAEVINMLPAAQPKQISAPTPPAALLPPVPGQPPVNVLPSSGQVFNMPSVSELVNAFVKFRKPFGVYQDPAQLAAREYAGTGMTMAARGLVAQSAAQGLKAEGMTAEQLEKMRNGSPEQVAQLKNKIAKYGRSKQKNYSPSDETIDYVIDLLR